MRSRFKLHYFYVIVVDQFRVGTVNLFIPKTEQESEIDHSHTCLYLKLFIYRYKTMYAREHVDKILLAKIHS